MRKILGKSVPAVLVSSCIRFLVYAVFLGSLTAAMMWGAVTQGGNFYRENGPVETAEAVFCLAAALGFLLAARQAPAETPCAILLAGLFFCFFIREWDELLDSLFFKDAWQVGAGLVLVLVTVYVLRHWQDILASVSEFVARPSFGIFISGLLVLIVFSRLFGYGPFWKTVTHGNGFRTIKRIAEEGVEQMGYCLIFISSLEYLYEAQIRRKKPTQG